MLIKFIILQIINNAWFYYEVRSDKMSHQAPSKRPLTFDGQDQPHRDQWRRNHFGPPSLFLVNVGKTPKKVVLMATRFLLRGNTTWFQVPLAQNHDLLTIRNTPTVLTCQLIHHRTFHIRFSSFISMPPAHPPPQLSVALCPLNYCHVVIHYTSPVLLAINSYKPVVKLPFL